MVATGTGASAVDRQKRTTVIGKRNSKPIRRAINGLLDNSERKVGMFSDFGNIKSRKNRSEYSSESQKCWPLPKSPREGV